MSEILQLLQEAARLLGESRRHFKSRQVAEARRRIEQAITQLGDPIHANKTGPDDHATQKIRAAQTDQHHD